MTMLSRNFARSEFLCKCGQCNGGAMDLLFIARLQGIRDAFGQPLHINCGARCAAHNKAVGGVDNSRHLFTADRPADAADIRCPNSVDRYRLLQLAFLLKIGGVGVYDSFIHLDGRSQGVCWVG